MSSDEANGSRGTIGRRTLLQRDKLKGAHLEVISDGAIRNAYPQLS